MNAVRHKWFPVVMTLGVAAAVVVAGCGGDDSGLDRRYKVTGHVTYKGEPVQKGTIAFEPVNPPLPAGRHASGFIENGSYTLTTAIDGDGALPGDYKVLISSSNINIASIAEKTKAVVHQGGDEFRAMIKNAKSLVPIKYARSETSDLKATVGPRSQEINFTLPD
jgi:hypothetical protein